MEIKWTKLNCSQIEQYYEDYLNGTLSDLIDEGMIRHFAKCEECFRNFLKWGQRKMKTQIRKEITEEAKQMACHEIGWWKAHHRKDTKALVKEMADFYRLLFGLTLGEAGLTVGFRINAAKFHDKAEEYEDKGNQKKADVYWNRAKEELQKHFTFLEKLRKRNK